VSRVGRTGLIRYQNVPVERRELARSFRKAPTRAEAKLWGLIRDRKLDLKFRRQQPIDGLVADFFCEEAKAVIEVDGPVHQDPEQKIRDAVRETAFLARGIKTIRFTNKQIFETPKAVQQMIVALLKAQ
jgi:very-short-patch-repair endonuclease